MKIALMQKNEISVVKDATDQQDNRHREQKRVSYSDQSIVLLYAPQSFIYIAMSAEYICGKT